MTLIDNIKEIIEAHGIECTDEQINAYIAETEALIGIPGLQPHPETDILLDFDGDVYVTEYFPILPEEINITIDNKSITPKLVDYEKGIIYLCEEKEGFLQCTYTTGVNVEEYESDLLPIVTRLISDNAGQNISSITEGDISISYKTSNSSDATSLDALVQKFKNKYDTLIRWA